MFKFAFQVEEEQSPTQPKDEESDAKTSIFDTHEPEQETDQNGVAYACEELHMVTSFQAINPEAVNSFKLSEECTIEYLNHLALMEETFGEEIVTAETDHSDLVPNRYEGGLKVWECTFDLGTFLADSAELKAQFVAKTVLDLGCGAGILGIEAKLLGASEVHFQDYNKDVLTKTTMVNYELNDRSDDRDDSCKSDTTVVRFFSGDWASFTERYESTFDLILTSETIYNAQNYGKLLDLFDCKLSPGGIVYLAAKTYYFGSAEHCSPFSFLSTLNYITFYIFCSSVLSMYYNTH
ncbi:histidine protein methyltransferase 1 homolog [Anopheles cruzii]|uniref:histidine protein methyltransferase 1 homolog n=1 Tax=Anopheles cruzii TaxID=68878 RepID=UPI0022EC76BA|nr:histidine protein methyltransferase 1 homolog [Anopheles cruzii]